MATPVNQSFLSNQMYMKILEKQVSDLEDLCKKLTEQYNSSNNLSLTNASCDLVLIKDDSNELQKFCSKLEYLLQFNLKEKKSLSSALSASPASSLSSPNSTINPSDNTSNKEYWSFIVDVLKSSRSFEDAIKYVKNITEIKTNLGKARAFIRFCLQYHRLADAIQQLIMDNKVISYWYYDKSVWFNQGYTSRIIQLLYDLNDINFDLISKSNFELDISWPSIHLNVNRINNINSARIRTHSISSYNSFSIDQKDYQENQNNDQSSELLGSTPLEMDGELMFANIKSSLKDEKAESIYDDDQDINDRKMSQLQLDARSRQFDNSSMNNKDDQYVQSLLNQIQELNEKLNAKNDQNNQLNTCLMKQANLSENLSEMLRKNEEKCKDFELNLNKHKENITNLQAENDKLKIDLQNKANEEENLKKETILQIQSIKSLQEMCSQQERTIQSLKLDLNSARQERETEIEKHTEEKERNKIAYQLKEEENYLLNDQLQKLSKSLDDERKQTASLTSELSDIKKFYKDLNEKNTAYVNQLEMDNNEIKKRLVKLIKEKAELWQKADNLEYENLLKTNAMWIDDSIVSNCMSCSSGFSLLLRKHHCRICLKIYCYYCCNNWIEYNNSKLRVCKRCFETKENVSKKTTVDSAEKDKLSNELDSYQAQLNRSEVKTDEDDDDDDDPDINFEVRPEKLNTSDEHHGSENSTCIYERHNFGSRTNSEKNDNENNPQIPTAEEELENKDSNLDAISVTSSVPSMPENILNMQAHSSISNYVKLKEKSNEESSGDDVIVRRKKIKKKKISDKNITSSQDSPLLLDTNQYDLDTFAIVSQEEIDKIK